MPRPRRQDYEGALFRGRFLSVGLDGDAQLVRTLRYIHLNPVEAGLCGSANEWRWSSAGSYDSPPSAPRWLTTREPLSMFGSGRHATYADFMSAGIDEATRSFYRELD